MGLNDERNSDLCDVVYIEHNKVVLQLVYKYMHLLRSLL